VTLPLALSGDQWIALVGVSSGAVVGLGSLVFAYLNGKSERAHGERLARSGRLHEQRHTAYVEIARLLSRQRLFLIRTEPIIGPKPDPPPPLDDDEWAAVNGVASISPSPGVLTALEEAAQKPSDFEIAVFNHRRVEANPRVLGDQGMDARMEMDTARDRALAAITEAERAKREELAKL